MTDSWDDQRTNIRRLLVESGASGPIETVSDQVGRAFSRGLRAAAAAAIAESKDQTEAALRANVGDPSESRTADDIVAAVLDEVDSTTEAVVSKAIAAGSDAEPDTSSSDDPNQNDSAPATSLEEAQDAGRALIEKRRKSNDTYLKKIGLRTYGTFSAASFVAAASSVGLWNVIGGGSFRQSDARLAVLETALGGWVVFSLLVLLNRRSGGLRRLIIGKDGRFSTSLTQAALWTISLFYVLSYLFLVTRAGCGNGCTYSPTFKELDTTYLILLGGPFAAAAAARATVSAKVAEGSQQKTTAAETSIRDIVSNDAGVADLADTQFFLFNVLALVFFFAAFLSSPTKLPDLPPGLVALTSVSALAYATNKAIARNAPVITAVSKATGAGPIRPGDIVVIRGTNFVPPGAEDDEFLTLVSAKSMASSVTYASRSNQHQQGRC